MLNSEKQIHEYERTLAQLKEQNKTNSIWSDDEIHKLEIKLEELKSKVYSQLSPWERVIISRHPDRPHTIDFIRNLSDDFTEIYGDRLFRDDPAIITGFARIGGEKFVVVGQEKGCDTESRLHRNFGMPHPEGYRKALRAMHLAEKFNLPVLSLIDTPGAFPGIAAEERGQGWAIANNLFEMAQLSTPIIAVLIGEGCSGGALGIGVADAIGMLEHAYYSVISPEACSSILWKESSKKETAASALKMNSEDLLEHEIIDEIIDEPLGGAHYDPSVVYNDVKQFILEKWLLLKTISLEDLLEYRYQKFRKMGQFHIVE